jgi:hypothetical protein
MMTEQVQIEFVIMNFDYDFQLHSSMVLLLYWLMLSVDLYYDDDYLILVDDKKVRHVPMNLLMQQMRFDHYDLLIDILNYHSQL